MQVHTIIRTTIAQYAVATCYDPLLDNEPALACTMAASVKQRIVFRERTGQKVRRIGSGFGYEGERPELTGPRCASLGGFSLHANTQIPAHQRDQLERLMRYTARGAMALEWLAEDANGILAYTFKLSPLELLARLLGRVFDLAMAICPWCRHGSLRVIATMIQESVITRILRHLKLASVPPPIGPARVRQATFDWVHLSPRRRAWSQGRRARSRGVSHTSERLQSL